MNLDENMLQQVVEFTKAAIDTIEGLEAQQVAAQLKEAAAKETKDRYTAALDKVAEALSENGQLEVTKQEFFKRAQADPVYLVHMLERICKAAEVASIGKPARVATQGSGQYDPVMAKAFGYGSQTSLIDE